MAHPRGIRSNRLLALTLGWALFSAGELAAGPFDNGPELLSAPNKSKAAEITAELTVDESTPDEVVLSVTIDLPPNSYLPSMAKTNAKPTVIKVQKLQGLEVATDWEADHAPKKSREPALNGEGLVDVEKYVDKVTWTRRLKILSGSTNLSAELAFDAQYCSSADGTCNLLFNTVPVSLELEAAEPLPFEFRSRPTVLGGPYPGEAHIVLAPNDAKPGDEVTLSVTVTLDDPWHVYSTTMEEQIGGLPTAIKAEPFGLAAIGEGFTTESEPEKHDNPDDEGMVIEYFEKSVTWTRSFKVTESRYGVRGSVRYMTCADGIGCKPPTTVEFAVGGVAAVAKPSAPAATESPREEGTAAAASSDIRKQGLVPFLLAAAAAGFLALLTPCVFPMVPITVSFFLKQAEKEHSKPLVLASVYGVGIIATFTILGLLMAVIFGATKLNELATNPWMNLAIAGVLVFFGANLLGFFEIRMPSWLVNWSSGKQGQGGYIGTLFMAFTFTLMSFTCTFAFAGGLLVWAAKGDYFWPILGMLAFSAAFALPFFFLALFPSYLNKLPKSGGWMNTVKVTMGMLEIGAAFKFMNVFAPLIVDYSVVMCAWFVISVCTGLYLLGVFRLGHDTPTESISVTRLGFAMGFLGLAAFLANGLYGSEEPKGVLWDQIAAFAPPRVSGGTGDMGPYREDDGLKYALDVEKAIEFAKAEGKPLFFDFTGYYCTNCRLMEEKAHRPENKQLLEDYVLVQLYLDMMPPEIAIDSKEADRILARNRELAVNWLGDVTMPSYAVVEPNGDRIEDVQPFIGLENEDGAFNRFLKDGLDAWQKIARSNGRTRIASR